jgi:hypothetical protein
MCILLVANLVWNLAVLKPIFTSNDIGYRLNSSTGVRHEHNKLESQA